MLVKRRLRLLCVRSLLLFFFLGIAGCTEKIDQSNRYTFVGETIAGYLETRTDAYSDFVKILSNAKMGNSSSGSFMGMLATYGSYTCFAPTNKAIQSFLFQQDSIYWESVRMLEAGEIGIKDFVETGIHSPNLEDLSDSMATEIARNHLMENCYLTTDLTEGSFPTPNMNDRFLTISWVNNAESDVVAKVNNNSHIVVCDKEVENGVVQTLDAVLNPSTALLPDLLKSQDDFSIYAEALFLTGMDDSLRNYRDENYTLGGKEVGNLEGTRFMPYPETKYYKNTLLVLSNKQLAEYEIMDINDLIALANKWYGRDYYNEVVEIDYTNRKNPLNRFISYHIIDRQLHYASGNGSGGFIMENYQNNYSGYKSEVQFPTSFDRCDYFETFLPYTSIKVTKPFTNPELNQEIVLNYAQNSGKRIYNPALKKYTNVIVYPQSRVVNDLGLASFNQNAINGIIHVINTPIIYNEAEMKGNVLNERMRMDALALWPELTNNNIRWRQKTEQHHQYVIPDNYCKRLKMNAVNSMIGMYCPTGSTGELYGDAITAAQNYDFSVRLPHFPEGTYEIRYAYQKWYNKGIAQFYVDGRVTGIPLEMSLGSFSDKRYGWVADTGDWETDSENDKAMRNRGYLKGPDSVFRNAGESLRSWEYPMRMIITMTFLQGNADHWLRIKNVAENWTGIDISYDYLEFVPKGIITDSTNPENRH